MVEKDQVKEVTIQSGTLTIVPKSQLSPYGDMTYYTNQVEDENKLTERLENKGISFHSEPPDAMGEFLAMILSVLLPTVLLFVMLMFFMKRMNKGGGVMGVGKSRAKAYIQKETGITFKDVAGQDLSLIHIFVADGAGSFKYLGKEYELSVMLCLLTAETVTAKEPVGIEMIMESKTPGGRYFGAILMSLT